ncbi:hypothetical protein Tco_0206529 [Tanacetum coccineum]
MIRGYIHGGFQPILSLSNIRSRRAIDQTSTFELLGCQRTIRPEQADDEICCCGLARCMRTASQLCQMEEMDGDMRMVSSEDVEDDDMDIETNDEEEEEHLAPS